MADADDEVCKANMPLACVPMVRDSRVPDGMAAVLLHADDGRLCLAVHPLEVSQQAVDEYNHAMEHVGRHGIGTVAPARPHPAI